jgi:hypothetical protein
VTRDQSQMYTIMKPAVNGGKQTVKIDSLHLLEQLRRNSVREEWQE